MGLVYFYSILNNFLNYREVIQSYILSYYKEKWDNYEGEVKVIARNLGISVIEKATKRKCDSNV
jgi:hypothetical protein